ncbi:MAG: TolC family protein [Roseobacter sp.]|nr:TolC family protein [Roseobacter sp.]
MSLISKSVICAVLCFGVQVQPSWALSLEEAIKYVLETNPDITAAEANKQAIEFELDQARSFRVPRVELEAFAGTSRNDGETVPDLSSADSWIEGYELNARVSQLVFDGFETRSEIERQAYRIDAAAYRVLERAEVLSLEAVRLYSDVLRVRNILSLARENADYHRQVLERITRGYDSGVIGIGDLQQAEERLFLAEDTIIGFELDLEDIETLFLATVGVDARNLGTVRDIGASVPVTLEQAIATARARNPTILFSQADVGTENAQSRRVDANKAPRLFLEADARVGEDVGGFEGDVFDARVGLVLRYEFQGTSKRAAREEQARRVGETRARLLAQTRLVESEVRQSWSTLKSAERRTNKISAQAELARRLLATYEAEYDVGERSLLDVLNTQNALFQAEANLVNARALENYAKYRIMASAGILLPTLGIDPPEDARIYARDRFGAPPVNEAETDNRQDASSFRDWRQSLE